jgi:hypothetical protein
MAEGPPSSECGDGAVDDSRIDPGGVREVQPQLVDGPGPEALHEHVGAANEPVQDLEPAGRLEVEGEALLVAIQRDESSALPAPVGRSPGPRVIAAAGPLDLDNLGPHVSKGLGTERSGHVLGQIGNDDAL